MLITIKRKYVFLTGETAEYCLIDLQTLHSQFPEQFLRSDISRVHDTNYSPNFRLLKQVVDHRTNRFGTKPEALGLTAKRKTNFSLRFTRREAGTDVPDKCVSFAVSDTDLKPDSRLKKHGLTVFFEESGRFSICLRSPALVPTYIFIVAVMLKVRQVCRSKPPKRDSIGHDWKPGRHAS